MNGREYSLLYEYFRISLEGLSKGTKRLSDISNWDVGIRSGTAHFTKKDRNLIERACGLMKVPQIQVIHNTQSLLQMIVFSPQPHTHYFCKININIILSSTS